MGMPGDEARVRQISQVIARQVGHMVSLVDDLLDVSRVTRGLVALEQHALDLNALLPDAVEQVRPLMDARRHTLAVQPSAGPACICADRMRIVQIAANLLTNAAKYTPDGGRIELHLECEPGLAVVRVRDSGIGIPPEALASVFEMFSQLEPALERARGGLGIGLALVRGIVALHGGSVHADSAGTGRGSEFTVRLPLAASAECAPAAIPADTGRPAALRILVVDDNRDAAEILTMALELSGCETVVAHSAGAALDLAEGFRPQVGLLDIGLPDMTGYELARRLRQLPDCESGLVLIAATGWGQDKDRELAFEAGFDHHLTKPIDFDQLRMLLPRVEPE
jgi:CheY-like chemotaxis protein/two-component sensor histidine kinase